MSQELALAVVSRMNHREMAIAVHYAGLNNDFALLARTDHAQAEQEFMQRRRIELVTSYGLNAIEQRKPFAFSNGIAIIPVHGTLINRFSSSWGFVTGYNFIRQQTFMAGQDPDVSAIVYDTNTYGGEAAGCFECSADLKKLANGKPTMTVIDSNCYSAGYAMASGTDQIVCTPSGGAGSIGVVAAHISLEGMLKEWGIKVTLIHAGAHKVDGNPYEDLPDSVKADIQKSVDLSYDAFVSLVSSGRKMDEKAVRATEARCYRAEEAKSLGLIDAVATPQEAMRAFMGELSGSKSQLKKEAAMSDDTTKPGATTTPEQTSAKVASEAKAAERARVSAITTCEEAKGREALANHFAFKTDMSVDDAKAALAAAPKAAVAEATGNPFKAAMDKDKHPEVGADTGNTTQEQTGATGLLANARAAGVMGYEQRAKH